MTARLRRTTPAGGARYPATLEIRDLGRPRSCLAGVVAVQSSRALTFVAVGALGLSFAAVLVKWISLGPASIGVYRTAFAAIALLALTPLAGAGVLGKPGAARTRGLMWAFASGLFFAADLFVWHRAIVMAGSGIATLLAHTQVFWVAVVSALLLGERLRPAFALAVLVALAGVVLVSLPGIGVNKLHLEGVGLGLATGVFYSGYILTLRESLRGEGLVGVAPNLAVSSATCATALTLAAFITAEHIAWPGAADLALLIALALGVQVGSWLLISRGMPHLPATSSSVLLLLQPMLATVWGVLFFAEPLGWVGGLGVGVTLAGVYAAQRLRLQEA